MSASDLKLRDVFALDWGGATQFYWGRVIGLGLDKTGLVSGAVRPSSPVVIDIVKGGRPGDFLWNGAQLVVASERVVRILQSRRFSGYSTYPVEVRLPDHNILEGYVGISILGRAGPVDPAKSRIRWSESLRPDGTRSIMAIDGLYFDPANWDGSDLFSVDDFHFQLLMVARVAEALQQERISNYKARPLREFRFGY